MKKWLLVSSLPVLIVTGVVTLNVWAKPQPISSPIEQPVISKAVDTPKVAVETQPVVTPTPAPQIVQPTPIVATNPYNWSDSDWACIQTASVIFPFLFSTSEFDRSNLFIQKVDEANGTAACDFLNAIIANTNNGVWQSKNPPAMWTSTALRIGDYDDFKYYNSL